MSQEDKYTRSYQTGLYGLWWQFCEYLKDQRIVSFSEKFHKNFCHELLILKSKLRDLNSRLGGCGICASEIYCSNFLENKEGKRLKWPSAWFIFDQDPEAWAHHCYSIWSATTSCTIYDQDFGAWAPHSLEATGSTWKTTRRAWRKDQKQPEGCSDYLKYSKAPSQVLDACRTQLRRARGLVRPGVAGLLIGIECSRVRDSSWMYLTSFVTTRIGVELATVQGNYPIVL